MDRMDASARAGERVPLKRGRARSVCVCESDIGMGRGRRERGEASVRRVSRKGPSVKARERSREKEGG
eukprot:272326-Pleurochrysis_carterae.AAC.1